MDTDDHATLAECLAVADREGVHAVVNNPCFEIWLLWHLEDHRAAAAPADLAARLAQLGHPNKSLRPTFPCGNHQQALERALMADPAFATRRIGPNPSSAMPILLSSWGSLRWSDALR